jgi:hypothetical protein
MEPEVARYVIGGLAAAVLSLAGVVYKLLLASIADLKTENRELKGQNLTMVESNIKTVSVLQAMVEAYQDRDASQTSTRTAQTL